jgi:hypothetical protein
MPLLNDYSYNKYTIIMIQKRYEYWSNQGKVWSDWFDFEEDNSQIDSLREKESKQYGRLNNEYRII